MQTKKNIEIQETEKNQQSQKRLAIQSQTSEDDDKYFIQQPAITQTEQENRHSLQNKLDYQKEEESDSSYNQAQKAQNYQNFRQSKFKKQVPKKQEKQVKIAHKGQQTNETFNDIQKLINSVEISKQKKKLKKIKKQMATSNLPKEDIKEKKSEKKSEKKVTNEVSTTTDLQLPNFEITQLQEQLFQLQQENQSLKGQNKILEQYLYKDLTEPQKQHKQEQVKLAFSQINITETFAIPQSQIQDNKDLKPIQKEAKKQKVIVKALTSHKFQKFLKSYDSKFYQEDSKSTIQNPFVSPVNHSEKQKKSTKKINNSDILAERRKLKKSEEIQMIRKQESQKLMESIDKLQQDWKKNKHDKNLVRNLQSNIKL